MTQEAGAAPSRGNFDARFITPLSAQNFFGSALVAGDPGIAGARLVVPGRPEISVLLHRLRRHDLFRMPPVSVDDETPPVVPLMEVWIRSLPTQPE